MTRQFAVDLAPKVRVNVVGPYATSNARNRGYDADFDKKWGSVNPMGRVAYPEDYVGPCVFLASDDAAFVTGQILYVDGGWTLQGYTPDMAGFDFPKTASVMEKRLTDKVVYGPCEKPCQKQLGWLSYLPARLAKGLGLWQK